MIKINLLMKNSRYLNLVICLIIVLANPLKEPLNLRTQKQLIMQENGLIKCQIH
jgi:hypothetical protein